MIVSSQRRASAEHTAIISRGRVALPRRSLTCCSRERSVKSSGHSECVTVEQGTDDDLDDGMWYLMEVEK